MAGAASETAPAAEGAATLNAYLHPKVAALACLGFSSGLPLLLIFATLSLWLREAGVERAQVTYFSWAALGYSFKFVWAPLIDKLPLPGLAERLGQRRSWLLASQLAVIGAIALMAHCDPATEAGLAAMADGIPAKPLAARDAPTKLPGGRAGRRGRPGAMVFITTATPIAMHVQDRHDLAETAVVRYRLTVVR